MEGDRRKLGKGEKGREGENEGVCVCACVCVCVCLKDSERMKK